MTTPLILAIDQGTTSTRAVVFTASGKVIASAQKEFEQFFPANGWVEHDVEEIWRSVVATCEEAIEQSRSHGSVQAVGITNQRETTVVWNRKTGAPVHKAIVWQDRRTSAHCEKLRQEGYEALVKSATGLVLDPYFSATKIQWILDNTADSRAQAQRGELAFGTIDSYLIYKLTGGQVHATDMTNAARTMLFNIHTGSWDEQLLDLFCIPASVLPEVRDCDAHFGDASEILPQPAPIHGVLGDQHAAVVGQCCFEPGMIKSTYGTGNFVMLNTGTTAIESQHRLLTTIAYRLAGKTCYALEGSVFIAGAVIQWLRDKLKIIEHAKDSETIAKEFDADPDLVLVPAFTGLGAPYWDADARGAIFGMSRDTGFEQLVIAALESVCYQSYDLIKAMQADGASITNLRVDGGMSANNWLMQQLADILNLSVQRPTNVETTVLGAASVAAFGAGLIGSLTSLAQNWELEREFKTSMQDAEREQKIQRWHAAINKIRS